MVAKTFMVIKKMDKPEVSKKDFDLFAERVNQITGRMFHLESELVALKCMLFAAETIDVESFEAVVQKVKEELLEFKEGLNGKKKT